MATGNHRRSKQNWYRESLNPMGPNAKIDKDNYRLKSPWDQESVELEDEFERQLNAVEVNISRPWDECSEDLVNLEKEKDKAKNYKYRSLFEVPELSDKKKKQLASYEYNPPFNCGFNAVEEEKKTAKKLNPGVKNPKTRAPWTYGELPAEQVHMKVFPRPSTGLWEVPKGDQSENTLESSGDPVLDHLRVQLKKHGALGMAGLARKFRIMDDDGSGNLSFEEFRKGMKETGVSDLSDKALRHLFLYFDRDDSGAISYDEFLGGVRGVMNERRRNLVQMAFKVLDSDGSGEIDVNDIKGVYNAKFHPDVVAEKKTEEEVLADFLQSFERPTNPNSKVKDPNAKKQSATGDGVVTLEEFIEYYQNISASIDNDDYFELMIRNAWHISGGKGVCENTTNRRILVTDANGNQTVQEIKDDIRIRKDDTKVMIENLKKQGIENVASINTSDKINPKNTQYNPNIVEIRTKYAANDAANSHGENSAVPVPLNAYFNQTMTHGMPKNLSASRSGRPNTAGANGSTNGRLQLDTNSINRSAQNNGASITGSSPMPLNAYAPNGGKPSNGATGNVSARNSVNNANAAPMNMQGTVRPQTVGYGGSNSRPPSARTGLNRTMLY